MEENNEDLKEFNEFIENLDIDLATLEKFGATLLAIAYVFFIYGSNLDIADILEVNDTGLRPSRIILYGAIIALVGYFILWIVAEKRLSEEKFRASVTNNYIRIPALQHIAYSYLLSVWVNVMRADGFAKLDYLGNTGEEIV